ncbi:mitotic checkpoint serine/threonine-protein kinase BUB1 isoform X1 [Takifugu flavidus]|uniref:mitotic checkpoint serine/threonine-protein kinase BUB1 isoform X1 n=1 Tax=Takifugu flavidus TaxID=433684 RepID=UPI0025446AA7|nr:mitotic checkpoint serine/threonine-protein kinase BUB1 isoform X1 [Takifugu flavidus]
MDINAWVECFEKRLSTYTGDDPLDQWDKFVDYLEQRIPEDDRREISQVFDSLVQRFLTVERYSDDIRYVKYCIKCASFYQDPTALYTYVYSKGVGHRTAALYVTWAQHFERRGMYEEADAVYQKAVKNQAQPAETVLNEYRQFQTRTKPKTSSSAESRNPLQNSHVTNQLMSHQEQHKASGDCSFKHPTIETIVTVSRSETSGTINSSQSSNVQFVSEYLKDELLCEGSELCFEEVRAAKYFRKLEEQQDDQTVDVLFAEEQFMRVEEENFMSMRDALGTIKQALGGVKSHMGQTAVVETSAAMNINPTQHSTGPPQLSSRRSSRRSLGLRLLTEPTFIHEALAVVPDQYQEERKVTSSDPDERLCHPALTDRSVRSPTSAPTSASTEPSPVLQAAAAEQMAPSLRGVSSTEKVLLQEDPEINTAVAQDVACLPEPDDRLNMSQGGTGNLSHITPNTSLGFVQATPSRVLPSPTVNTREALDVIMDMFQAPTLLEDPFNKTSAFPSSEVEAEPAPLKHGGDSYFTKPRAAASFTIFQDEQDKENISAAAPHPSLSKSKPIKALAEIRQVKKSNETPPELMPDESTMWGARYNSLNSLAACPNSTTDFAMLAQCVSTPFAFKTPHSSNFFQDEGTTENSGGGDGDDDEFMRRQPKKLSPIMEQSPAEETAISHMALPSDRLGTIVGEGLASAQLCSTSSTTLVQAPPPGVLSFRDQTISTRTTLDTDQEQPPKSKSPFSIKREPFKILEDLDEPAQNPVGDVPMSPEGTLKPDWLSIGSPEVPPETDLDAFLSPCRPKRADVPMTPEPPLCTAVPMSPATAPQSDGGRCLDVSMSSPTPARAAGPPLVSDPWDNDLISDLLSALTPPLPSHPHYITWSCNMPAISPRMTITMGKASLRVDCILGEGAFATVYQATNPATLEKVVLKVQKPANPWEFYINTQLDARLQPHTRHLFSNIRSAHLFNNGSVLLAQLHNYGTLLNAVNIYKTLSEKLMPQPLVMYLATCILTMVEQLHAIHIIHADIKPDNFLLGERFLENRCFEPENLDHGLVLIDLGQSIDLDLFPEGTAFTAKCLTSGFQCTEMLSGKPWNYQTDYFGVAGTVHCMLFGTYMQVTNDGGVWKTNGVFRRIPHSDLWQEFFHVLLNVPDCSGLPSLRGLRGKLTSVLQQDYSNKLGTLKSRLVVQLLERRKAAAK